MRLLDYSRLVAEASLQRGSILLRPDEPFVWASGYQMPIYNDNRFLLGKYSNRVLVAKGFKKIIDEENIPYDVIAGTSTGGITPGATLANLLEADWTYVRDKPKAHGLKNRIEGLGDGEDYGGRNIILVEDLISTGGSSVDAVQAIRDANGNIDYCFSVFSYNLDQSREMFEGKRPFKGDRKLDKPCNVRSLLNYDTLLEVAIEKGYIKERSHLETLREWRTDPFGWGIKRGFLQVK